MQNVLTQSSVNINFLVGDAVEEILVKRTFKIQSQVPCEWSIWFNISAEEPTTPTRRWRPQTALIAKNKESHQGCRQIEWGRVSQVICECLDLDLSREHCPWLLGSSTCQHRDVRIVGSFNHMSMRLIDKYSVTKSKEAIILSCEREDVILWV